MINNGQILRAKNAVCFIRYDDFCVVHAHTLWQQQKHIDSAHSLHVRREFRAIKCESEDSVYHAVELARVFNLEMRQKYVASPENGQLVFFPVCLLIRCKQIRSENKNRNVI